MLHNTVVLGVVAVRQEYTASNRTWLVVSHLASGANGRAAVNPVSCAQQ
jgi:hypothetical protein